MNKCIMFRKIVLDQREMKLKDLSVVGSGQDWFVEYTSNDGQEIKKQVSAHCKDCAISEAV